MRRRQLNQALPQNGALILLLQDCLGTVRAVGNFVHDLAVERLADASAQRVQRLVAGDREHPGGNLRTPFETAGMLPDVEKHLARYVLGGGALVHEPQRETVDSHMMAGVEDLHCESVAGGDAFDEPFIGTGVVTAGAMGGKLCKRRTISHLTSPRVRTNPSVAP